MTVALTNYAISKRDNYVSLKQTAQTAFSAANVSLAVAQNDYDILVETSASTDKEIASLRQQLAATINLPADIDSLNDDLLDLLIERSHIAADLSSAKAAQNEASVSVSLYQNKLAVMASSLALAESALVTVQAMAARHTKWTAPALEDEITLVRDNAIALLADSYTPDPGDEINPAQLLSDARARVADDTPEVLSDRARARATLVSERLAAEQTYLASSTNSALEQLATSTGSSGVVTQRWAALEAAEDDLRTYALTTTREYQRAIELLQTVIDSTSLTVAESDAVASASLGADADAVTTEVTLHAARAAVQEKSLELATAIVAASISNINADPSAEPSVVTLQAELDVLVIELIAAETAHTEEFEATIDIWEATLPNFTWHNLQNLDQAEALLTSVSTTTVAGLSTALGDAENALISALTEDDDSQRLSGYLNAVTDSAEQIYRYLLSTNSATVLSALRGDF